MVLGWLKGDRDPSILMVCGNRKLSCFLKSALALAALAASLHAAFLWTPLEGVEESECEGWRRVSPSSSSSTHHIPICCILGADSNMIFHFLWKQLSPREFIVQSQL